MGVEGLDIKKIIELLDKFEASDFKILLGVYILNPDDWVFLSDLISMGFVKRSTGYTKIYKLYALGLIEVKERPLRIRLTEKGKQIVQKLRDLFASLT